MRTYRKVFEMGLKLEMQYRFQLMMNLFFSAIPMIITVLIWNAVYQSGDQIEVRSGFSFYEMVGYLIFANITFKLIQVDMYKISNEIRSGELNVYLLKPLEYIRFKGISIGAKFFIKVIFYAIPLAVCIWIFKISLLKVLMFLAFLIIALGLNFLLYFALSLLTFWLMNISGIFAMVQFLISFLAGTLVPNNLFPEVMKKITMFLPFKYLGYAPAAILFHELSFLEVGKLYMGAIIWIILLFGVIKILWKVGIREYGAFGG